MTNHGIHHVTAIAGPAQRNLDFYTRTLGLRLVKKTVNFDDPGTYHFYFGDEAGSPGTILTFFPWEHAAPGRLGVGETQETVFRVPAGAIGYWTHRFVEKGVAHDAPAKRFGESIVSFRDPDGMRLALIGVPGIENEPAWDSGDVPAEFAIRGFHSVNLLLKDAAPTGAILTDVLGFTEVGREGSLVRFKAGDTAIGGIVDIHAAGAFLPGRMGARLGASHRVSRRRRRGGTRDGEEACGEPRHAHHGAEGPQLLPLGLFPRAGSCAVRDRNRRAGLCHRRAGGVARPVR